MEEESLQSGKSTWLFISSFLVGLTRKLVESGSFPTRTAPTGPFQGMSDRAREAEAAFRAKTSGS